MDTTPVAVVGARGNSSGQMVTTDFLLKSLQENTIIKSFTAHLGALSQRVDVNAAKIGVNSGDIAKQGVAISDQGREIASLASRVRVLEKSA